MISWLWLLPAFVVGSWFGLFVAALLHAANDNRYAFLDPDADYTED